MAIEDKIKAPGRDRRLEELGCTPGITYCVLHTEVLHVLYEARTQLSQRAYGTLTSAVLDFYMTGREPELTAKVRPYFLAARFSIETTRKRVLSHKPQLNGSASAGSSVSASEVASGSASTSASCAASGTQQVTIPNPIPNPSHIPTTTPTKNPKEEECAEGEPEDGNPPSDGEEEEASHIQTAAEWFEQATKRHTDRP